VLGRLWVGIFLAVAYVVVSVLVRREERGLLEDLKALPPDEQEEVLSHDPELANELRPKLRSDSVPPNWRLQLTGAATMLCLCAN
jgi:hypothetical protein